MAMAMAMNGDAEEEKNCYIFGRRKVERSWWVRMMVADQQQQLAAKPAVLHTFPTLQIPRLLTRTPPNKFKTSTTTTTTTTVHPTTPGEVAQVTSDLF